MLMKLSVRVGELQSREFASLATTALPTRSALAFHDISCRALSPEAPPATNEEPLLTDTRRCSRISSTVQARRNIPAIPQGGQVFPSNPDTSGSLSTTSLSKLS